MKFWSFYTNHFFVPEKICFISTIHPSTFPSTFSISKSDFALLISIQIRTQKFLPRRRRKIKSSPSFPPPTGLINGQDPIASLPGWYSEERRAGLTCTCTTTWGWRSCPGTAPWLGAWRRWGSTSAITGCTGRATVRTARGLVGRKGS